MQQRITEHELQLRKNTKRSLTGKSIFIQKGIKIAVNTTLDSSLCSSIPYIKMCKIYLKFHWKFKNMNRQEENKALIQLAALSQGSIVSYRLFCIL